MKISMASALMLIILAGILFLAGCSGTCYGPPGYTEVIVIVTPPPPPPWDPPEYDPGEIAGGTRYEPLPKTAPTRIKEPPRTERKPAPRPRGDGGQTATKRPGRRG
jgi:hypothetical protein